MSNKKASGAGELNDRQTRFIEEYLKDANASQAAYRAGYSQKNPNQQATKLMRNPAIKAEISRRMKARSERVQVDADYVLKRLTEIDQLDVLDIVDDSGNMRPLREWPKEWRQSITGIDIQEIMSGDVETVVRKIKWPDKLKNLELIGKHVDVRAFEEERERGTEDLAEALTKMAERLPG